MYKTCERISAWAWGQAAWVQIQVRCLLVGGSRGSITLGLRFLVCKAKATTVPQGGG